MNIAHILVNSGKCYGHLPAIAHGNNEWLNYSLLAERCSAMAHQLVSQYHLKAGDHVALIAENCPQYIEICFSLWYAGLVVVPINAKLHPNELHYLLEDCSAKVCFSSKKLAPATSLLVNEIITLQYNIIIGSQQYLALEDSDLHFPCKVSPNDAAWIFYTSGTTGKPKGALLSHQNLFAMVQGYFSDIDKIDPGDSVIHAAPMSHGSGFYILPHVAKGGLNVIPTSGGFSADELTQLIQQYQQPSFFAAPTMVKRLVEYALSSKESYQNLKTIVYGGGPMYQQDLANALAVFSHKLVQMYGQGESPMTICALSKFHHQDIKHPDHVERLASIGLPVLGMEVKLVDSKGLPAEIGCAGEIYVRGKAVMLGYLNNEKASNETLVDGWLKTGDIAVCNKEGFIKLVDRNKDVIISGGSNIYPREVEEVLNRHPAISEASVIGKVDDDWGEVVVAVVVLHANVDINKETLDQFCIEHMTRFKRPKYYHFIDELPKNNTGKILKTTLRNMV